MAQIIIRHYAEENPPKHVSETREALLEIIEQYRPRYEALGHSLELEKELSKPEEAEDFLNLLTLGCSELGLAETPLEKIVGAEIVTEEIDSPQGKRSVRALTLHGKNYLTLPRGMLAEGLLRTLLALTPTEGGCSQGCQGCSGRCSF